MLVTKEILIRRALIILFWIWATFGFVADEILPTLEGMRVGINLLLDAALILLGIITLRDKEDKVLLLSFLAIGFVSTCIANRLSTVNFLNGCRDFFAMLFVPPILKYFLDDDRRRERFIKAFDRHLWVFLIIQAPCLIYQFLKYGANDHGGGSLGNGFSGIISTLIYITSFYLISKNFDRERYFHSLRKNIWLIVLLFPTFLNETKISFVFFLLYFLLLLKFDKSLIMKLAIGTPIFLVGLYFAFNMYLSSSGNEEDITDLEYYMESYLMIDDSDQLIDLAERLDEGEFGEDDDWSVDLPRFSRILLMPAVTARSDGGIFFGAGLSQFKGMSFLEQTKFAKEFEWFVNGTVLSSQMIFAQLGILGVIWALAYFIVIFRHNKRPSRDKYLRAFIIIIFLLVMLYNQSLRFPVFCIPVFYFLFRANNPSTQTGIIDENNEPTTEKTEITHEQQPAID